MASGTIASCYAPPLTPVGSPGTFDPGPWATAGPGSATPVAAAVLGPTVPPVAVAQTGAELAFAPEVHRVPLDQQAGSPWAEIQLRSEAFLLPRPDGSAWLTWNQGRYTDWKQDERPFRATRFMRLGADLQPAGASQPGPAEMAFSAAAPLPDGGFAAIAQREKRLDDGHWWPHEAWFLRYDAEGREVARHLLMGEHDRGPGQDFFQYQHAAIAASGDRIGVYMELTHNFAAAGEPENIHAGDLFVVFGPDNRPIPDLGRRWLASHSSSMRLVAGTAAGTFWGLTVGDGYPIGLQFMGSHLPDTPVVWRPKGDKIEYTESAGYLGAMARVGELAFASVAGSDVLAPPAIGSREQRAPLLLALDGGGRLQRHRWLDVARFNVGQVSCQALGDDRLLVGWGSMYFPVKAGEAPEHEVAPTPRFAIYDPARDQVTLGPREADLPFSRRSPWARLADGSVAWAVVQEPDLNVAAIVRVRPR